LEFRYIFCLFDAHIHENELPCSRSKLFYVCTWLICVCNFLLRLWCFSFICLKNRPWYVFHAFTFVIQCVLSRRRIYGWRLGLWCIEGIKQTYMDSRQCKHHILYMILDYLKRWTFWILLFISNACMFSLTALELSLLVSIRPCIELSS
jgi:hypothetical protein